MKLSKKEVLDFIDTTSAALKKAHEKCADENGRRTQRELNAWRMKYEYRWKDAVKKISAALRRGDPVTSDMIPREGGRYSNSLATFDPPAPSLAYAEPHDLVSARRYLKAIVGDTVVDSSIFRDIFQKYSSR